MRGGAMSWEVRGKRGSLMELPGAGAEWIEVRRSAAETPTWRVEARLAGQHYKLGDAFATKELAQGSALLLAIRLVPAARDALHAALDAVPDAWWWKITPGDESAESRAVFSSRITESAEAAEQSGRAAGAGWWLTVYGPGSVRAFGQLPR
jgi:hypothetical protein